MKQRVSSLILIVVLIASFAFTVPGTPSAAFAQKVKQQGSSVTFADLDAGAQLNVGKRVFYTPTAEEGCDASAPQGCKYPAVITGVPTRFNRDTGKWEFLRTPDNHIVVDLTIFRPASKGGTFDKGGVGFTSSPIEGTCREIATEDLRGVL